MVWQKLESLNNVLETAADGALAVVIISLVFAFLERSYTKLGAAMDRLCDNIAKQTEVLAELIKNDAVQIEVLRGISDDINHISRPKQQHPKHRKV